MKKQWIVGTALLMLMTGNVRADGEPPTENILKDQFKKQYHGILKLDAITLKNLDAKGNQATWSAEVPFLCGCSFKLTVPKKTWAQACRMHQRTKPERFTFMENRSGFFLYGGVIFRRLFVSIPVAAAQKTQSFLPFPWRHA